MSHTQTSIAVTGMGWELPGTEAQRIPQLKPGQCDARQFDARAKLGRSGLRYKDHATLLALSAGRSALLDAGLADNRENQADPTRFGVVVSSNLGNLDTVARVVDTIRTQHVDATSAMDLPSASSNVISSSLAIRFGLQGINLMLCNGATSGLDAVHIASNCIRAGRATRMLVVGVEVDTPAARHLLGADVRSLFNGAVAVVLEEPALNRRPRGYVGGYRLFADGDCAAAFALCGTCFADDRLAGSGSVTGDRIDVSRHVGESYGTEGLVQLVAALHWFADEGADRAVLLGGGKLGDKVVSALEVRRSA